MGLIYIATNKINGKSYIGQTTRTLEKRIQQHYTDSKKYDYKFARALRKYKKEDFEWKVLYDNIPQEQLNIAEICAIYIYDTYYGGYNSTLGGDINPMQNIENRLKISKSNKGKRRPDLSEYNTDNKKNSILSVKHKQKISNKLSKSWEITKPDGKVEIIINLNKYCVDNHLSQPQMSCGKYKNYKCKKIEELK